jgi:hypothetical protein
MACSSLRGGYPLSQAVGVIERKRFPGYDDVRNRHGALRLWVQTFGSAAAKRTAIGLEYPGSTLKYAGNASRGMEWPLKKGYKFDAVFIWRINVERYLNRG